MKKLIERLLKKEDKKGADFVIRYLEKEKKKEKAINYKIAIESYNKTGKFPSFVRNQ